MLKEATPRKKKSTPPKAYKNTPYVRFTGKMLYLNGNTMHMLGCCESISICVDKASRIMVIRPDGPFRLSRVCETPGARRIETNGSLLAVIEAGFPRRHARKAHRVRADAGRRRVGFADSAV